MKTQLFIIGILAIFMLSFTVIPPNNANAEPAINIKHINYNSETSLQKKHLGEILIDKADCLGCHKKDSQLIGPSYKDVAKKYANNEKNITLLANRVIKGSTGVWGQIPMTPHPKTSLNDAKLMVKYILTLKK